MKLNIRSDLYDFFAQEAPQQVRRMLVLTLLVGGANTLLISLINSAAQDVAAGRSVTLQFFGYAALLVIFLLVTRLASQQNIRSANELIYRFRIRIMSDVLKSNLVKLDGIGRDYIMAILSRDSLLVTNAITAIVSAFQSVATLLLLTIYMATVSLTACFIILTGAVIVISIGLRELFKLTDMLQQVAEKDAQVNQIYGDFLSGYKEIKMSSNRATGITQNLITESKQANQERTGMMLDITNFFSYLDVMLYLVVGLMVFVVPVLSADFAVHVTTAATTSLFLTSSLTAVITNIPTISMANVAARTLTELSEKLAKHDEESVSPGQTVFSNVNSISLCDVVYVHGHAPHGKGFTLGPVSVEFEIGKVYFIRGNNGSGKTTLMRVLIGLYQAQSGSILVNGEPISEPANTAYRDLFSVVFSDFYLFGKLYGLKYTDAEINDLLSMFEMEHKVSVTDGQFSDLGVFVWSAKENCIDCCVTRKKTVYSFG